MCENIYMPPAGFEPDIKECSFCNAEWDIHKMVYNESNGDYVCPKCITKSIELMLNMTYFVSKSMVVEMESTNECHCQATED